MRTQDKAGWDSPSCCSLPLASLSNHHPSSAFFAAPPSHASLIARPIDTLGQLPTSSADAFVAPSSRKHASTVDLWQPVCRYALVPPVRLWPCSETEGRTFAPL